MADYLAVQRQQDGVVIATLNRPAHRNALRRGDEQELIDLAREINTDLSIKALVLTGAGSVFCAGADLSSLQSSATRQSHELAGWYTNNIQRLPIAMLGIDVPTIVALNGPAIGIGFDISCMFDIRIAAESCTLAQSFIAIGLIPGDGGAWLSQQVSSYAAACEMAFTGDPISAYDALRAGIVSKVVADGNVLDESVRLASRMARRSGPALRMSKRLMRAGRRDSLETVLQLSAALQAIAHGTEEHHDAIATAIARLQAKKASVER